MKVSLIAAIGNNHEIGKNNDLLWHLPYDMKFFKETTLHHHVIMGRKNYESIPPKYRPFSYRTNVVISKNADYQAPECYVATSLEEALEIAAANGEEEAFVIGGGQIYQLALQQKIADCMYITRVNAQFPDADAYFPEFDTAQWDRVLIEEHPADLSHAYDFSIWKYTRKTE